jgi:hypothetical protein
LGVERTSLIRFLMSANDPKRTQETLVLEFFQSARVNGTIGVQALRGSHGDHENNCRSDGPERVVVTVLAWLAVISGILPMLLPFWAASIASSLGQSSTPVIIGALVPLLVGAFLSYKAFTID